MSQRRYFVSGATGSTGGHAARLRDDGVEVVIGDLHDLASVRTAMADVDGAFLVYPVAKGLFEATAVLAQAAVEAEVAAVVNMSQIPSRRDAVSHATRDHWIGEQLLDRSAGARAMGVTEFARRHAEAFARQSSASMTPPTSTAREGAT